MTITHMFQYPGGSGTDVSDVPEDSGKTIQLFILKRPVVACDGGFVNQRMLFSS